MNTAQTLADIGETQAIALISERLGNATAAVVGVGDDCAVLAHNGNTVVTSDTMIEGNDFRLDWHTPYQLGWKLAASNLSDVQAMGATPTALTVAIACPASILVSDLLAIADGLAACCAALAPGCAVVGGDLAQAPVLMCAVTALGELAGRAPIVRSGAQAGDVVAYAGSLGWSGLGLSLLYGSLGSGTAGGSQFAVSGKTLELWETNPRALTAHLTPVFAPGIGAVATKAGATAMLDVSDGLVLDAARIARVSGVCIDFSRDLLLACAADDRVTALFPQAFAAHIGNASVGNPSESAPSLDNILYGGEDHGLLGTFPAGCVPPEFMQIGAVLDSSKTPVLLDGKVLEIRGWDSAISTS